MAHTPGPWEIDNTDDRRIYIRPSGTGWLLAVVPRDLFMASAKPDWSIEANARLIAAAPGLLAASKDVQCGCSIAERESGHLAGCWFPALDAAITKAEGRT